MVLNLQTSQTEPVGGKSLVSSLENIVTNHSSKSTKETDFVYGQTSTHEDDFVYGQTSTYDTKTPELPKPVVLEKHIPGSVLGYFTFSGYQPVIVIDKDQPAHVKDYVLKHEQEHNTRAHTGQIQDEASVDDTVYNQGPNTVPRWRYNSPAWINEQELHANYYSNPTSTKYLLN